MDYFNFELEIGARNGDVYPVSVVRSAEGEANETMHFPFGEQTLATQLVTLQQFLANPGPGDSLLPSPGEQSIQKFGEALFTALFTGEIGILYEVSRAIARNKGKGLRVKLRIQPPELAALPWEFLYDPRHEQYLCLSDDTPVVRYLDIPEPLEPLTVDSPLSILGMTANPKDITDLDVAREQKRIEAALAGLQAEGLVQITWLTGHTWMDLQQALLRGSWHVFHFIGHGGFNATTREGVIALEDAAGQARYLSASQLARLLADHHPLRLVVLNSCKGAASSTRDIFSSTAATLVRRGIPAVLAHQYTISDQASIALSRTFYEALAAGLPVDASVAEARKAISLGGTPSLEWGTPVLCTHTPDGVLFTASQSTPPSSGPLVASPVIAAPAKLPFSALPPSPSSLSVPVTTPDPPSAISSTTRTTEPVAIMISQKPGKTAPEARPSDSLATIKRSPLKGIPLLYIILLVLILVVLLESVAIIMLLHLLH
ncbi:MAG TPA: CHAT domain-containing protein [Ktedonobacteraceae bacterium]|nr:CHAT domain-containing protein [Ktedonobacteraceae bacterium]